MPRRVKELAAVAIICVLTVIGLVCATVGINVLPKCRYGAPDCYFIVELCAYSDIEHAPPTPNSLPNGVPGISPIATMVTGKVKDTTKFKPDFCQRVNKM